MNDQLITNIYNKLVNFTDPVSNKVLNKDNEALNIICKDGHAQITLNIDPREEHKYNNLSIDLNKILSDIQGLLSVNVIFTAEKNIDVAKDDKRRFQINSKNIIAIASGKVDLPTPE